MGEVALMIWVMTSGGSRGVGVLMFTVSPSFLSFEQIDSILSFGSQYKELFIYRLTTVSDGLEKTA